MVQFVPAILVAALALALACRLAVGRWRRIRRRPERGCPKCDYDMLGADGLRCPECGYVSPSARWLSRPPVAHRWLIVFPVLVGLGVVALSPIGQTAGLRSALWLFGPDARLDPATGLRIPVTRYTYRGTRYERLAWNRQVAQTYQDWARLAATTDGSLASLESLVPAAIKVQTMYRDQGTTRSTDSWYTRPALLALHRRIESADRGAAVPVGTWAWSTLRYNTGNPWTHPRHRDAPREVMETLAASSQTTTREFVAKEIGTVRDRWAQQLLEQLAEDTDPGVRAIATNTLGWRATFGIGRP